MPKQFLDQFSSTLPASQQTRLQDMISADPKLELNVEELETKVRKILERMGHQEPTMELRLQGEKIDSESYNQTLREILADLFSLYYEANLIGSAIYKHDKINVASLEIINEEIKRLERRIDSLNLLADNYEGYSSASREDFDDESKMERDRDTGLFVDKNKEPISEQLDAHIDSKTSVLELATMNENYDRIHSNGETIASIYMIDQVGEGFRDPDCQFGIEKAIDLEDGEFWGEVILSDDILRVPITDSMQGEDAGFKTPEEGGITRGATCTFKIVFPNPCNVSEIEIDPYCEYPLEIINISYTSDETNNIAGVIKAWDKDNPLMFEDHMRYSFPKVSAKSIIITLRQEHATVQSYFVTREQRDNRELWAKVGAINKNLTLTTPWQDSDSIANPSLDQDKIDSLDETWQLYLEDQRKNAPSTLDSIIKAIRNIVTLGLAQTEEIKDPKPDKIQVNKFEYIYGAHNINISGKEYFPEGIYISKPHNINGNVQQIVLESKEFHPTFERNGQTLKKLMWNGDSLVDSSEDLRRTSVEYYITASENPSPKEWIPILPLGTYKVNQEFIKFVDPKAPRAEINFECDNTNFQNRPFVLYKNEYPLIYGHEWWFAKDNAGNSSTKFIAISTRVWQQSAMFTMDYYPKGDPNLIDFSKVEAPLYVATEYFLGTNKNNSIKLSKHPFVDRSKLKVNTTPGQIIQQDYAYNPVRVTLNPDNFESIAKEKLGIDNFNREAFRINGHPTAIISQINPTRDPNTDIENRPRARTLNVTDYFDDILPTMRLYSTKDRIPTFEYIHDKNRVHFTETFKHDGPVENFEDSNGNAVIQVDYEYLVSGIRVKIILRRTSNVDASVSPKVDFYTIKSRSVLL